MTSTKSLAVLNFILLCGVYFSSAQKGFLSIDCGGKGKFTDENGITWIPDDNYIEGGRKEDLNFSGLYPYLQSVRVFPKPLRKSCYQLPITPNVPFFFRLYFMQVLNYSDQILFKYSIETKEMLSLRNLTNGARFPQRSEKILVSAGNVLYICLIRTSEHVDPFISSIELRSLRRGMYYPVNPRLMLHYKARYSFGPSKDVRYPDDPFDRVWLPKAIPRGAENVTSVEEISTNYTENFPPTVVMQRAAATELDRIDIYFKEPSVEAMLLLYFAEIRNSSGSTVFSIATDNVYSYRNYELVRNRSAIEISLLPNETISSVSLLKNGTSTRGPIINGLELYERVGTSNSTSLRDVQALSEMKTRFSLSNWISDPCFAIPWDGIKCDNSSKVRVLELNLLGKNLTGSIPRSLANMNALINISLANNHLTGNLPNLSQLFNLERLYLQNNNLSGEVPEWLAELPNLKELFIGNNNFSGVIPQKLVDATLLNLNYDGNHYLCMKKGQCRRSSHSNGGKWKFIAGTIAGSIAIGGLLFLVGIIIYLKKFRRKKSVNSGSKGSTSGKSESIYLRGQDFSMVLVPNSTKTRSFALEEMITATENFIHKIGQGGFGSVFLGKLQEGKQIAVKVLSSFSKQGAVEFLNEIDLLSRVHHKNLVSLLGYCNESRELMLAYEYMPGGSLRDHLYGLNAEDNTKLDWKTRLKIALDAAYGLEYLHVGCTPKIIHRDVKTANILLDANLNGKLADFGLSRVTIDGEATHVTTTVKGTAGYLDPEYFSTQMLTEKSDVYSFGVVLLEIICGRRPIDVKLSEEEVNLIRWVAPYVQADGDPVQISKIVDKRLQLTDNDAKSVTHLAKLAIRCVEADPSARPTVSEVIGEIKVAIKYWNENNAGEVYDDSEFSGNYSDRVSGQASITESSGPKEIGSSENSLSVPP